jgi:hypothetical protein
MLGFPQCSGKKTPGRAGTVGSSALALDWLSSRANNATLGGKCIASKPSNMHISGRVQTGYMQHHPLIGEYTLERNELNLKRLRKSAYCKFRVVRVDVSSSGAACQPCRFLVPHPPEPVLCLGGTQSSAFGQLSGLFYLNIPKCVKHTTRRHRQAASRDTHGRTRAHGSHRRTSQPSQPTPTHLHRTTARRPDPRPSQQPQPRSQPLPAADSEHMV